MKMQGCFSDLNSVLIQGRVKGAVNHDGKVSSFEIESVRQIADGQIVTVVPVIANGKLGESSSEHLSDGREVRVVGRLGNSLSGLKLLAEHIEYR